MQTQLATRLEGRFEASLVTHSDGTKSIIYRDDETGAEITMPLTVWAGLHRAIDKLRDANRAAAKR